MGWAMVYVGILWETPHGIWDVPWDMHGVMVEC